MQNSRMLFLSTLHISYSFLVLYVFSSRTWIIQLQFLIEWIPFSGSISSLKFHSKVQFESQGLLFVCFPLCMKFYYNIYFSILFLNLFFSYPQTFTSNFFLRILTTKIFNFIQIWIMNRIICKNTKHSEHKTFQMSFKEIYFYFFAFCGSSATL